MKNKILCLLLVFCLSFCLAGCGQKQDYIEKTSENISSYTIKANYNDESKMLVANQKVNYKNNTGDTLDEVRFHLYPNAFRQDATFKAVADKDETNAYPSGKSYGEIKINKVVANGKQVDINVGGQDENILIVQLDKGVPNGESVMIEIDFCDLLPKVAHRFGYTDNAVCFGNWYPIACVYDNGWVQDVYCTNGDPFYSEMANYNVEISYPKYMQIATTGNAKTSDGIKNKTTVANAKTVRDFAFVLSDKFEVLSTQAGDVTIKYFYFNDKNANQNLQIGAEAVQTFSKTFGQYPYDNLCIVQTDFLYGGMEYPNLVYIASNLDQTGQKQVIVHEIAHQWWYNLVGNNQVAHAWLDEGLTDYSTALFFKLNEQYKNEITYEKLVKTAERNYTMFVDVLESFKGGADTTMTRATHQYKTEQEYVCMTYTKGMLLFDSLAFGMGQNKMQKCLQNYFDEFKTKTVKPNDMIKSFGKTTGTDLAGFFNNWLDGKVTIGVA
ncbi:MAG: M1 family metallopeptidase [Clostridiales bacterium]|nr:M1 family metallopeptidase [Clostridiales bacterium]